ncbi:MAG TPA: CoA transferase, partial [Planococcus sp. (in: firmicutes)]|nr:CoA transferase [Planococcus sp. (in: firmicutes)]
HQFAALCNVLGKPELALDEKYRSNPVRVANREELIPFLQQRFLTEKTAFWQGKLKGCNVPSGPIQNLEEVVQDKQLQARNMFIEHDHPTAGRIKMIGSPLKLSRTPVEFKRHPPLPGDHNDEVFNRLNEIKNITN